MYLRRVVVQPWFVSEWRRVVRGILVSGLFQSLLLAVVVDVDHY